MSPSHVEAEITPPGRERLIPARAISILCGSIDSRASSVNEFFRDFLQVQTQKSQLSIWELTALCSGHMLLTPFIGRFFGGVLTVTNTGIQKPVRIKLAWQRLELAVDRLEAAVDAGPDASAAAAAASASELKAIETENTRLREANAAVAGRLDDTISRLKTVLNG